MGGYDLYGQYYPRESYDPKCMELAKHFLPDERAPEGTQELLAQAIQDAIEDFFADELLVIEGR